MASQSKITIRRATLKDLPAISRLARIPELAAPNRRGAEQWWIRDHIQHKQMIFVAVAEKNIIGFIMGEGATGHVALLHLLTINPRFRKTGIAGQLGLAFQRECRRRHMVCILTYATKKHPFLSTTLKKHGFTPGSEVQEFQKAL